MQSLHISRAHTFRNCVRDELWSVVTPNVIRRTARLESVDQNLNHIARLHRARLFQYNALTRVLIDDGQPLQRT